MTKKSFSKTIADLIQALVDAINVLVIAKRAEYSLFVPNKNSLNQTPTNNNIEVQESQPQQSK